ncbi:PEP-CTERM sorting domain-containing protein [Cephaloticoccus primus]|nr:PEP-CTERM sorting domain-containing protein [Cephaloticoccus primus]
MSYLNTDSQLAIIGKEGIVDPGYNINLGEVTSTEDFINVFSNREKGDDHFWVNAIFRDHPSHKVGLRFVKNGGRPVFLYLVGNQSNTFTGDVIVEGQAVVDFVKGGGARGANGNLFASNGGTIGVGLSNQISSKSHMNLRNRGRFVIWGLGSITSDTVQSLKKLTVDEGRGVVEFSRLYNHDRRFLYLDDLMIADGAGLDIRGWEEGFSYLLVRKDSKHLADALKKITFDGYLPGRVHLEDFNKDYWQISGTPEPATYGAIFAGAGVGLIVWRRRRWCGRARAE